MQLALAGINFSRDEWHFGKKKHIGEEPSTYGAVDE